MQAMVRELRKQTADPTNKILSRPTDDQVHESRVQERSAMEDDKEKKFHEISTKVGFHGESTGTILSCTVHASITHRNHLIISTSACRIDSVIVPVQRLHGSREASSHKPNSESVPKPRRKTEEAKKVKKS